MPITSVEKDLDALTMTVVADFPVPVRRLWDAYADPRQIEKFWGPVEWPATFTRHDMTTGGRSTYYMSGPDGQRSAGYWEFLAVEPGRVFEVR
ncbi:SRPBCC domain-containing protein, partial [Georgenia sp. 10Sc9-8]|nr:SRPBCC domain-containing protein [Georgenia halotolerans]